jgi:basic membrane lipoprotein Med (substrate-binding protein (PBP1-ABC) superfamily)
MPDIARRPDRRPPGAIRTEEEGSMIRRRPMLTTTCLLVLAAAASAGPAAVAQDQEPLDVKAVYSSVIEEPWDGVIHAALEAEAAAGRINHTFQDGIGYEGDMEPTLREIIELENPDIIFGDSFGNEEAVRAVAADYPEIPFVFGSGGGPAEPNFSVFDNWIHEPAYLAGMLAGGLTKSGIVGVVAGHPVPEVNRITNAFIAGAREVNPDVEVKVNFINSWFDLATAKEAALAQIGAGADVLYAERAGVIEAAAENELLSVGNMADQQSIAPESVITSVTWNMTPTVEFVVDQVLAGAYTAQDLKDFNMFAKGGSALAPINEAIVAGLEARCASPEGPVACTGQELIDQVKAKEEAIRSGLFRVDINESTPPGSVIPPAQ